jgi:rhamnose transport system ATP-binding protein
MGENGAGNLPFIKVITGVHREDEGEIYLDGKKVEIKNPKEAIALVLLLSISMLLFS